MVVDLNKRICIWILLILAFLVVLSVVASAYEYIAIEYSDPRLNLTNQYWKVVDDPINHPDKKGYVESKILLDYSAMLESSRSEILERIMSGRM